MSFKRSELRKRVMVTLKADKLPIPESPGLIEEYQFPSDLTILSDEDIRKMMSFWTAHLGYLLTYIARCQVDVMVYKRELDRYENVFRKQWLQQNDDKKNPPMWMIEVDMHDDPLYIRKLSAYTDSKAIETVCESMKDTYKAYYTTLSRELSARLGAMSVEAGRGI
jgi:hypothetical protein